MSGIASDTDQEFCVLILKQRVYRCTSRFYFSILLFGEEAQSTPASIENWPCPNIYVVVRLSEMWGKPSSPHFGDIEFLVITTCLFFVCTRLTRSASKCHWNVIFDQYWHSYRAAVLYWAALHSELPPLVSVYYTETGRFLLSLASKTTPSRRFYLLWRYDPCAAAEKNRLSNCERKAVKSFFLVFIFCPMYKRIHEEKRMTKYIQ